MKNIYNIQYQRITFSLLFVVWIFSISLCNGQEVVVPKKSVWKYSDSGQNLGTSWYLDSFNDDSWLSGPGIFGYGGGDEGTVVSFGTDSGNKIITTYFRKAFTLTQSSEVNSLVVRLMRDDGAVVYLNGNFLFSSNMPDNPDYLTLASEGVGDEDERTYYSFILPADDIKEGQNIIAVEVHQYDPASSDLSFDLELEISQSGFKSVVINEVLPRNFSYYPDPDFNQFTDWIELFNPQQSSLFIGGYYLTDDLNIPDKWQIPPGTEISANGYLIILADGLNQGLHASFSLDREGERIGLFSPDMELVDSLLYPPMYSDVSYGIMPDGESRGFFGNPTPSGVNIGGTVNAQPVAEPIFSKDAGFYASSITVQLSSPVPQGTIRYTIDGSDPDKLSARYEAPFTVSHSSVVKARVYVPEAMPSKIITKSYFINNYHDLPVFSIGTNSDYLDDYDIGIYREDRLSERREWERPGTMEFFEVDGSLGFQINIDYRLFGRGAIYLPQKSLAIFARDTDGYDGLDYELFPGTSVKYFQSFILRSSSDDWRNTMFRDGMLHTLLKDQMDLECMDYRPAVLYINGKYMGIHNIRDKLNEDYLATHKAADPANIDLLYIDNDYNPPEIEIKAGDDIAYWAMWDFITQNDMSIDANFRIASSMIDIDNYQNYCSVEIITGNRSWLHNRRVWRPRTPEGKFRYMLFDLDYGYIFLDQNVLSSMNDKDLIFRNLMKNQTFKAGLIQKLATYSNTIFATDRVLQFIDNLSGVIESEIPRHSAKWGTTYTNVFRNLTEWEAKVQVLRNFATSRPAVHEAYIQSFLGQPGKSDIEFQVVPPNSGSIFVNNSFITSDNNEAAYYNNYPLKLSIKADPGYRFAGWQGFSTNDSIIFSRGGIWKYNDSGTDLGTNWSALGYDDSGWNTGNGPLGYGRDHIETTISYGGSANQKYPTSYFRKEFSIQDKVDFGGFIVRLMRDDGAIVYLNGVEQFRVNMPDGTVNYSTYATEPVWGAGETSYFDYPIDLSDIVEGINYLAVEIHQESAGSSDLIFDLELLGQVNEGLVIQEISLNPSSSSGVVARFNPNAESDVVISEIFYRPTTSQGTDEAEFIELFNKGESSIDLSGWSFSNGVDFTFPQGTSIGSSEYVLLVNKSSRFTGFQVPVFQWSNGFLSNIGEGIKLVSDQTQIMDEVEYGVATPWPISMSGFSIELGDVTSDNNNPSNWSTSEIEGGTPGMDNSRGKFSKLKINEIVGLPGNIGYMNGSDWIEIANTGTEPIDIGGLFLSDDLMNPLKFRVPENNPGLTTVDGGGYIVLIADGQPGISALNLDFKLNANEGAVVLTESVGESYRIIDQLQYAYLSEFQSYGRSPDGIGSFINQNTSTPGAENTDFSSNIIVPYQIAPGDKFPVIVRITNQHGVINRDINTTLTISSTEGSVEPNRMKIRNGVGTLSIKVNTTKNFVLTVDGYNYSRGIKVNSNIPRVILTGPISGTKYLISGVDYVINDFLELESGAVLYAMPGVRLLLNEKISIGSKGLLKFAGSFNRPIVVMPKDNGEIWGGIKVQNTDDYNEFNWTIFTGSGGDSTKAQGHSFTQPTLYAQSTKMSIDQCFFVDNNGKTIYGLYAEIDINNSVFSRCDMGPELAFCHSVVKNSWFMDLPNDASGRTADDDNDGIYFRDVLTTNDPPNILENCVIYGTDDDGVDMSLTKLIISDCIINMNYEKGISAGWRSDLLVERCLFFDNYIAVSSTFWTPVVVTQSTFYKNNYAFYSSYGGGGVVNNSILSNHKVYYANDSTDAWYFEYCLSDSDPNLIGNNNLYGEAGFVNKDAQNFNLAAGSLAINAGNPELKRDADGTPADLGMFPYDGGAIRGLVIAEVYYNPPASQGLDEKFEFIEIINPGANLVDISGFRLIDGITFTFPGATSISPGEIILVASDAFTYRDLTVQVFEWESGKLSNSGERIALVDGDGQLVDEISYLDMEPWPELADGDGFSMELLDAFSDNSDGTNWVASSRWGGSPGELNLATDFSKISLNEIMTFDGSEHDELYQGSSSWLEVYNDGLNPVDLGGCKLSLSDGSEHLIPVGFANETTVQGKGYLVFFFNSSITSGANHIPLSWVYNGDVVTLSRNTNLGWSSIDDMAISLTSSSKGRYPDGASSLLIFPAPSPGARNSLASPDLITMKTVKSGERMPIILWKDDLELSDKTERNASVQVISGSADLRDTSFPMIEGVGSVVTKVTADEDFIIEVGEWQDTTGIHVDNRRHIFYLDKYIVFDQIWSSDHDYYIDTDLDIREGVTVTVLPGTRVFLISGATISVSGALKVLGTQSNPVLFAPQVWADKWGQIKINAFSGESSFQYAIFIGGGGEDDAGNGHTSSQAVIRSSSSDINMNNCFIIDNTGKGIYAKEGTLNLSNSLISRSDGGVDGKDAFLNIEDSYFIYIPDEDPLADAGENDAVFSTGMNSDYRTSRIINSIMAYVRDDAVDIYDGASTFVSKGSIQEIGDKAVSVTGSELGITYTLIQKSDEGLVAKEQAVINADHLTLFQNEIALHAYTNDATEGHGRIEIENSIISGSINTDLTYADGSTILVNYSLSDNKLHSGTGNILGDPLFVNPNAGDFSLQSASPAINAGNPSSPPDVDGSRTDLGAFIVESGPTAPIVINEIMYAPNPDVVGVEFVEIYNSDDKGWEVGGYYFGAGVVFEFPAGTIIDAGEYVIVTKQVVVYQGNGYQVFQWNSGDLSDFGEDISLMNNEDEQLDIVFYGNTGSWPALPKGMGPSLELKVSDLDNSLAENWQSSYVFGGTPGRKNSSPSQDGVIINEFMARNSETIQDDTGEYVDWVELLNASDHYIQLNGLSLSKYDTDLLFYNINGSVEEMLLGPGEFILFWLDGQSDKGSFHANFELAGAGGFLALSQSNGASVTILDSVYYSSMTADISYGRFPDATDDWVKFEIPTPGSSNNVVAEKISGLYINEILARNSSIYLNDIGEYDDWIELYNSTNEPIDVGGLYFSDLKSDPLKHRIPNTLPVETTIEPYGFLMLFASAKSDEGIRHLDFQLAGNGEHVSMVQLYMGQIVIVDSLTYPPLSTDISWGRTNDGGQYWNIFGTPTPNATNGISSIEDLNIDQSKVQVFPNPASERVFVSFTHSEAFDYQVELISPLSQTILQLAEQHNSPAFTQVSLSFDIRELGIDSGSFVFFRIRINEQNHIRKILIIGNK